MVVAIAVFGDVFGEGLEGEVRGGEGDELEKWTVGVMGGVVHKAGDGVVGGGGGGGGVVAGASVRGGLVVDFVVLAGEIELLAVQLERAVEACVEHLAIDVPFAGVIVAVSGGGQELGEGACPWRARGVIVAWGVGQLGAVGLLGVVSRHERGAGGPAAAGVVDLGEA